MSLDVGDGNTIAKRFHRTYFNKGFFQHNKVAANTIAEIEKGTAMMNKQQKKSLNANSEGVSQTENYKKNSSKTELIK